MALDTAKATVALRDLTRKFDARVTSATPFYPRVATIVPSTGSYEKYGWLGAMPAVREWLGDRKYKELRGATYELENKHWESSLLVKKTDINDDKMAMYPSLVEQLALKAAHHPDKLLSDVLVAGESSTGFDDKSFFATDHSWGDSGTQSNDLTYAAATGTTPTVAEFKAAFRAAVTALLGFLDDSGEPMNIPTIGRMDNLILMVPPELRDVAHDAIDSQILSDSSNVVIDRPTIVTNPYLTAADKFYVFDVGGPLKPFVFQAREPLSRQVQDLENIAVKYAKFLTEARYNLGYLAWWQAVLTTFT